MDSPEVGERARVDVASAAEVVGPRMEEGKALKRENTSSLNPRELVLQRREISDHESVGALLREEEEAPLSATAWLTKASFNDLH